MEKITELENVKSELESLLETAKFERTKILLQNEITKVTNEISTLNKIISQANSQTPSDQTQRKMVVDINQHAFDESEKFVKLYIPFDGAATLKDEDVQLDLNDDSFSLLINTPARNFRFTVTSLLHKIDVDKSYKKIKSNDGMIAVLLKKAKEGVTWKFLTATEKALKENKEKMFEKNGDVNEDPNNALMNIMKKMYESGDPEMKRTIAKAWTESQEKNKGMPGF